MITQPTAETTLKPINLVVEDVIVPDDNVFYQVGNIAKFLARNLQSLNDPAGVFSRLANIVSGWWAVWATIPATSVMRTHVAMSYTNGVTWLLDSTTEFDYDNDVSSPGSVRAFMLNPAISTFPGLLAAPTAQVTEIWFAMFARATAALGGPVNVREMHFDGWVNVYT
jgi:hypothetical protein